MPLTYAIGLFFVACLAQVMRLVEHGFGAFTAAVLVSLAMAAVALLLLGRQIRMIALPPTAPQYGPEGPTWCWGRTATLLSLSLVFIFFLVACASIFTFASIRVPPVSAVVSALAVQILVFALAQELFFREAVLKAFGGHVRRAFAVSVAAAMLFHLPHGTPAALMAAGGAAAYMALRVAGMNIVAVAAVHGATVVLFGRILVAEQAPDALWTYALLYALGHAAFAGAVLGLARSPRPARILRLGRSL